MEITPVMKDIARFHAFKFPNCEKELRKNLSSKRNHQNHKGDENVLEHRATH